MVENVIWIKSGITITVGVSVSQKEHHVYEKNVFGILLQLVRKTFFLGVIIGDSVDTCDDIIGRTKTVPTKSTSTQTV